jgi:hypothetical protein
VKYFKFGDEPNAAGLTEAEVEAIQKKLAEEMGAGRGMASEDYKHKESRWEAQSMKNVNSPVFAREVMHDVAARS